MPRKSIKDLCHLCVHFKGPNREHLSSKGKNSKEQNFLGFLLFCVFSSLHLPNSPSQFSGRSQDPLLEKHHHCSFTVGSSQHLLLPALSQTSLHTVPLISGACPKEPSKYPLWQNSHGSALMSKVSSLSKSLEVMRGNIWYKKPCSHCWDLVTAPASQECHLNSSRIKACADVYFAHR